MHEREENKDADTKTIRRAAGGSIYNGDELVAPRQGSRRGQADDANRPLLGDSGERCETKVTDRQTAGHASTDESEGYSEERKEITMPQQSAVHNGQLIEGLLHAVRSGKSGLNQVPMLVKRVIEDDMWRDFVVDRTRERVTYNRFIDFVTTKPLEGLGADLNLLNRICAEHTDVLDLITRETQGKPGNPTGANQYQSGKLYNVQDTTAPVGNSSAAALRRLRKDRPDLLKRVIAGKLSPHGGMVEAGFRPKTLTMPRDVAKVASVLIRNFSGEEIDSLVVTLREFRG